MTSGFTRLAGTADAQPLAVLARETFVDAFGAFNTPEHLRAYCEASFSADKQAEELADKGLTTLVSEFDDSLTGYAQVRLDSPNDNVQARHPAQLCRLYVRSAWHGRGVAQQLMRAVCAVATGAGMDVMWLGVWQENPRGIAFYKKLGFEIVGGMIFYVGGDPQSDHVMAIEIPTLMQSLQSS
jgi:ribosomal protein S18 acetylase RimI-like enzyme